MAALPQPLSRRAPAAATGARLLCRALRRAGVRTLFGYPGGAVLPLYDELARERRSLRHILARHEQGAVHMAEGYARARGRTGVVLVTSGPGATNALTGIANAMMDSTPLVVIAGQVPRALLGSDAFQETDILGQTRSCTKEGFALRHAAEIPEAVREAFAIAASGRPGPVVLELPKDVGLETAVWKDRPAPAVTSPPPCGKVALQRAADLLLRAERPVVYFGGGVVLAEAARELRALIERLNLPATPTLMALGAVPAEHRCSLGMLGMHGTYAANRAVAAADVLLAVGARFDDRVTGAREHFARRATIIHADVDASSFHKNVRAHLTLPGDARTTLAGLLAVLPPRRGGGRRGRLAPWWAQIRAWQAEAPLTLGEAGEAIAPQWLCREFNRISRGRALVATDVGQHQMWLAQYYRFRRPRQSLTSGGLGTMGYGLPAALGAQVAFPRRQVVAFVGDGGFQMSAPELATAVALKSQLKVIVLNNHSLGMVRQWQKLFHQGRYIAVDQHAQPDFVQLARAYGATGLRARRRSELTPVLERGLATPGVVVMDIVVSTDVEVYPMIPPGAAAADMVLG